MIQVYVKGRKNRVMKVVLNAGQLLIQHPMVALFKEQTVFTIANDFG